MLVALTNPRINAKTASADIEYVTARANAERERQRLNTESKEARSHLSADDRSNIGQTLRIPWIKDLSSRSKPHWGLVCFRTYYDDDEGWNEYKAHLNKSALIGLRDCRGAERVSKRWKIHYIEDDNTLAGANLEQLCR